MARYAQTYSGERRTRSVGIKLTPTERTEFEAAAKAAGVPLSVYLRDLCVTRSTAAVAAARNNPDAKALLFELSAIGNNINQLAKQANSRINLPAQSLVNAHAELTQ